MDFYSEIDQGLDILTGKTSKARQKYKIPKGVFIDQRKAQQNPVITKANPIIPFSGLIEVDEVEVLISGRNFPRTFAPDFNDYIIINHRRYEVKKINRIENNTYFYFVVKEFKTPILYEIHDIKLIDNLHFITFLDYFPKCTFRIYTIDGVDFVDEVLSV